MLFGPRVGSTSILRLGPIALWTLSVGVSEGQQQQQLLGLLQPQALLVLWSKGYPRVHDKKRGDGSPARCLASVKDAGMGDWTDGVERVSWIN